MTSSHVAFPAFIAIALGAACGGSAEDMEPAAATKQQTVATSASKSTTNAGFPSPLMRPAFPSEIPGPKLRGFTQSLAKSKAALKSDAATETSANGNITRYRGEVGTFVQTSNGYSTFSLRPELMDRLSTPFPGGGQAHNDRVKTYFLGAGLPPEQVGQINISAIMTDGGIATQEEPTSRRVLGHVARLSRIIDGIPVAESFAAARFNSDDVLVSEQVWWPELSDALKKDADEFRAMLSKPDSEAGFRAALPQRFGIERGALAIHHPLPLAEKWEEFVTWDVRVGRSTHHFDRTGRRVSIRGHQPD